MQPDVRSAEHRAESPAIADSANISSQSTPLVRTSRSPFAIIFSTFKWGLLAAVCILMGWMTQIRKAPVWSITGLKENRKLHVSESDGLVMIAEQLNGLQIRVRHFDLRNGTNVLEKIVALPTSSTLLQFHWPKLLLLKRLAIDLTRLMVINSDGEILLDHEETGNGLIATLVSQGTHLYLWHHLGDKVELVGIDRSSPTRGHSQKNMVINLGQKGLLAYVSPTGRFMVVFGKEHHYRFFDLATGLEVGEHRGTQRESLPIPEGTKWVSRPVNMNWRSGDEEFGSSITRSSAYQYSNGDKACRPDDLMMMRLRNGKFVYEQDPQRSLIHVFPRPGIDEINCKRSTQGYFHRETRYSRRHPMVEQLRHWAEHWGLVEQFDQLLGERGKPNRRFVELIRESDGVAVLSLLSSELSLQPYPKWNRVLAQLSNRTEIRAYQLEPTLSNSLGAILVGCGLFMLLLAVRYLARATWRLLWKNR